MRTDQDLRGVSGTVHGHPPGLPGRLLTADELGILRGMATTLSRLCDAISPIAGEYEERWEAEARRLRCRDRGGNEALTDAEATDVCPPASLRGADGADHGTTRGLHQDSPGLKGRSGDNPIDAITYDLRSLTGRIRTLCDTGILQATSSPRHSRTSFRLSDDGSIHARIDIPIDTSGCPPQSGTRAVCLQDLCTEGNQTPIGTPQRRTETARSCNTPTGRPRLPQGCGSCHGSNDRSCRN